MWLERRPVKASRLFPNAWLFLGCLAYTVSGQQCEYGLEPACVWVHDPASALRWKLKGDSRNPYVELTKCQPTKCGIGLIQSPWLPARDSGATLTLQYKIYGTSKVYLRVKVKLEDNVQPHQVFSKTANYAHVYPEEWSTESLTIPPTHTRYKLLIKAYTPYEEAMVAVKGINLDGSIIRTRTSDDFDYFPDDDDDEDERRFQALEVENFISEEDLVKGYTTVVEPQICPYKR